MSLRSQKSKMGRRQFRYCDCGRKIVIRLKRKKMWWGRPKDKNHSICRQCFRAMVDSRRNNAL